MSSISLNSLTKRFGDLIAVNALDLEIKDKEFVALLGPSGCGKTTTMNMITGIETPNAGAVRFDGRDVTRTPMGDRGVGFVFQNYAIFLHLSVYKNLAFGLDVAGLPRGEIDRRVAEMARLMRLPNQIDWPARRLSVNELQRVAIGRSAIVEPNIFLLDEPLSNLDAAFRAEMRTELKHFQNQLKQTMVYVTHDQLEAMSMADRIAVMDQGFLQQYGTPLEIYNHPINTFVARFIDAPSTNLMRCAIAENNGATVLNFGEAGAHALTGDDPLAERCRQAKSRDVWFGVRPEDVRLVPADGGGEHDGVRMTVTYIERIGPRSIVHLEAADHVACAVGDIMKEEYDAIHRAGFVLQLDCPDLAMSRHIHFNDVDHATYAKMQALQIQALNHATRDIPPEAMRLHLCWGNYEGPHHHDVPLRDIVETVLTARPAGLSFEAANPRHAHEYTAFEEVAVPEHKVLLPGVLDTTSNYIEHPELIADRICRFAEIVGRERVIASTDCGFSTIAGAPLVDPDIVWAKFAAMAEGAELASGRWW